MPQISTPPAVRLGLPEVPGNVSDVPTKNRSTFKQLRKLGTRAYDTREIIYYRQRLTQLKLKEELRKYGYTIQEGPTHGLGNILEVLETITEEIDREGENNETIITWVGARTSSDS